MSGPMGANPGAATEGGRVPVILLVEDNENDELLARHALGVMGISAQLEVARDGEEALRLLMGEGKTARRTPEPALVLLDLNLPKLNGHEVLRRLAANERTRHLPVVVLTSSNDERDVTSAYELGARSYVCKPIEFEQFVNALRVTLSYWLTANVPPPRAQ